MYEEGTKSLRDLPLNMGLCDSLIFRGAELDKEIGPQACRILLRDYSENAPFQNIKHGHLRCRRESWAEVLLILAGFGFAIASTIF